MTEHSHASRYEQVLRCLVRATSGMTARDLEKALPGFLAPYFIRQALQSGHIVESGRYAQGRGRPARVFEVTNLPLEILSFYYSEGDEV